MNKDNKVIKNFIDSLDEWLCNEMGLMGGCCSSIDSLKYTTARTVAEKLLKVIRKKNEIESFKDCTFYMTSFSQTKPKCIPDGLYILHERLGLSLGSDWNPENNEGVIGILSVVGDESLVISLPTVHQTIVPNVDFTQNLITDTTQRIPTVREFEKFFYDIEKLNELLKKTGGVPISCENFYLVDEIETESETEFENRFYNMNTGVIAPLSSLSVGSCICIKTVQDFVPFN